MLTKTIGRTFSSSRLSSSLSYPILSSSSSAVVEALNDVVVRVEVAKQRRLQSRASQHVVDSCQSHSPRLVAVSKTKPISAIIDCYHEAGHRHFGENYAKELLTKSTDPDILRHCPDIRWHFIGPASTKSNVKTVLKCPNLFMIETVQSVKIIDFINSFWKKAKKEEKLDVLIQINTSQEPQKGGVDPGAETLLLTRHLISSADNLNLRGFMTIGSFGHDLDQGPNPDFVKLVETRASICRELDLRPEDLELSMGMSEDFEHAIELGSTNVRIGSTIFGAREAKTK